LEGGSLVVESIKIYGARIADLEQPSSSIGLGSGGVFFTIDAKEAIQNDDM